MFEYLSPDLGWGCNSGGCRTFGVEGMDNLLRRKGLFSSKIWSIQTMVGLLLLGLWQRVISWYSKTSN